MARHDSRYLTLDHDTSSVREARQCAVSFAHSCELDDLIDDLELITSELVANAIRHADGSIIVSFACQDDRVRVEVSDEGAGVPSLLATEPTDETGRGLVVVADVADRWGSRASSAHWKTVWAELS